MSEHDRQPESEAAPASEDGSLFNWQDSDKNPFADTYPLTLIFENCLNLESTFTALLFSIILFVRQRPDIPPYLGKDVVDTFYYFPFLPISLTLAILAWVRLRPMLQGFNQWHELAEYVQVLEERKDNLLLSNE